MGGQFEIEGGEVRSCGLERLMMGSIVIQKKTADIYCGVFNSLHGTIETKQTYPSSLLPERLSCRLQFTTSLH